jgi:hypothetical protein
MIKFYGMFNSHKLNSSDISCIQHTQFKWLPQFKWSPPQVWFLFPSWSKSCLGKGCTYLDPYFSLWRRIMDVPCNSEARNTLSFWTIKGLFEGFKSIWYEHSVYFSSGTVMTFSRSRFGFLTPVTRKRFIHKKICYLVKSLTTRSPR